MHYILSCPYIFSICLDSHKMDMLLRILIPYTYWFSQDSIFIGFIMFSAIIGIMDNIIIFIFLRITWTFHATYMWSQIIQRNYVIFVHDFSFRIVYSMLLRLYSAPIAIKIAPIIIKIIIRSILCLKLTGAQ